MAIYPPMADVLDNDCCVCEDGMDHPGNDILECEQCKRAYHQACHSPQVEVVPTGGWLCDDCGRAGHRPSPEPARALGTLYTTSRADEACYRQFPYVIRFDDPQLDCIYTDGESKHQVRGQPSDEDRGAFIQGEIQLARPEPTGPAQTHARDREVQRELQEKLRSGNFVISPKPADPYRDIAPTGKYELRRGEGAIPCLSGTGSAETVVHSYAPDGT